jgi:serine/threonine-protein kinase
MSEHPSLPPGTLLAGKFRIERQLGAGAMGAVYAIHHELTRHRRALKLLHADVREVPDIVRRFLNEASAAGRAGSPHLVETFDAGTLPSGEPYVVMELLEGETLTALIERERPLDPALAAELVAQAAEGIESAHSVGIIHRDLKPDNLFVTKREGRPFVKILDFGVSKFATASAGGMTRTRAGAIYGSPAYMSPEQITGAEDIDPRTDVFALGVVLYQSLTSALPFDAPTLEALSMRIILGQATPIETLRPGLSVSLVSVVQRALAPKRDDRFASARALADALGPFRLFAGGGGPSIGFAETFPSAHPALAGSDRPSTPRRRRLAPVLIAALTLTVAGVATLLSRAKPQPPTAVSAAPPNSASKLVQITPAALAVTPTITPVLITDPTRAKPIAALRTHVSEAHAASASPSTGPASPAASASARPSSAQGLGLRQDNPFR